MSALFLGLTSDMTARRSAGSGGARFDDCLLHSAGGGVGRARRLLDLLGISLSAFRIAGGLLLLSSAAEMVFDRRTQRREDLAKTAITVDHVRNIAAFPLAIPLMAGPGAITAMILLAGRAEGDWSKLAALYGVAALRDGGLLRLFPHRRADFENPWHHGPRRHLTAARHHPCGTCRAVRD